MKEYLNVIIILLIGLILFINISENISEFKTNVKQSKENK